MTGADITSRYGAGGYFALFITPPGGASIDVTFFRGAPTDIGTLTFADPFGPTTAQFTFPSITQKERAGTGDMKWLVPNSDVDVLYFDLNTGEYADWAWEGYIISEDITEEGRAITCKGAFFQLDNFLAAPQYPQQPIPYELLIQDAFDPAGNPSLRTRALTTTFPEGWTEVVPRFNKDTPWYLKPWGVAAGQRWTGITSRSTGSWEPKLTGFVQTLLSVMFTADGGQWTIRHKRGRQPTLLVRKALRYPTDDTYVVDVGAHGVKISASRDFSQSVNVVYAQGQDLAGTQFSGQQVANDGSTTFYEPFAALPTVYPATDTNARLIPHMMRKESLLQLPQGVDAIAARDIAATQVRKHVDPGFTGSIELQVDPMRRGVASTRFLIRAGDTILARGLMGTDVLFHVSQATINAKDGSVSLTVDSKFRDTLTVSEVMARTRDALDPVRQLQAGRFSVTVQDMVKPWSYSEGSGVIPSGGTADATPLFTKYMGSDARFPWTDYTTKFPPRDYPEFYVRVPARRDNADKNWALVNRDDGVYGIPVKMSQAGSIRLTQIAAYDKLGNVKPVSFHVGIYGSKGISIVSMPAIPQAWLDSPTDPEAKRARDLGYLAGQRYPFFKDAFERFKGSGELQSEPVYLLADGANQIMAWGNYYERAGYSPGLMSISGRESWTGQLVDETTWSYDTTNTTDFDPYSAENTANMTNSGMLYVMIYCDDQDEDVYFLGRLWRAEAAGK